MNGLRLSHSQSCKRQVKPEATFMLPRVLTFLLLAGAVYSARRTSKKEPTKVDSIPEQNRSLYVNVSILMSAVGTPFCMKPCLGRFAFVAKQMISFKNSTDNFKELCSEYAESKECLDKRKWCRLRNVFDAATSGIEHACVSRRADFDKAETCLKKKLDGILLKCDTKCNLRTALANLSNEKTVKNAALINGNLFNVAKQLAPSCTALNCALPCIYRDANAACANSGTLILDSVLQPFDKAAALYEKAPQLTKKVVREHLSDVCEPYLEKKNIAKMRKGEF